VTDNPSTETLVFNGIDGASGGYLLPEMTPADLSALAQGYSIERDEKLELDDRADKMKSGGHFGIEADARKLEDTGWGVVLPYDADPAILEALKPLLDLRQEQAGERFKVFSGEKGYRPGESKTEFLERHGMGPGQVNADKVPYYLLVVGDPSVISYRFQYQLDVQYAVGRLAFDRADDYAHYALSAVQAEKGLKLPSRLAMFGASNPGDRATAMSADYLVQPLAEKLFSLQPEWAKIKRDAEVEFRPWEIQTILKEGATKANLSALLESQAAPALLFSATHGIAFPNGDSRQAPHQGALICQDWPGPDNWRQAVPQDFYFASDDLSSDANLLGTIAFFFACYGAGTPQADEFAQQLGQPERREIAPHDFIAALPKRMLSLPKGGALAVVGHVERAWGVSFFSAKAGPQLQTFQDCLSRMLKDNYPIGYAFEVFNNRYAEISSDLTNQLDEIKYAYRKPNDLELARQWTMNNDARNYILLGDPSVRLAVGSASTEVEARPSIPEIASRPEGVPEGVPEGIPEGVSTVTVVAAQTVTPPVAPALSPTALEDYGLMDSFRQAQVNLSGTLQDFVGKLGQFLGKALDEATSLEVSTYVSDDMSQVKYEAGRFSGAHLRALTRIEIDGDSLICVPETEGEVDTALWKIHMDMVQQAQVSRAELLKTVVSAATGLVDLLKP
jgi:Peptidase family C25